MWTHHPTYGGEFLGDNVVIVVKFPVDALKQRVIKALENLGFSIVSKLAYPEMNFLTFMKKLNSLRTGFIIYSFLLSDGL